MLPRASQYLDLGSVNDGCPTVDIIVNNHNYGFYLAEAIDSALHQDYPFVRVTVVDDGSTDDSVAIARGYAERIRLVVKPRGGQASALNAGFAATDGDVVAFLDADDILHPDFAASAVRAFIGHPGASKVVFRAEVIDRVGRRTGRIEPTPERRLSTGDLRATTMSHPFDLVWPPLSAQAFSSRALDELFPTPEEDYPNVGVDWYVTHAASLLGDVVAVERIGAQYRSHGNNAYFLDDERLALRQLRSTLIYAERTRRHLKTIGGALGLPCSGRAMSTSEAAGRLVSLRLDPGGHPFGGDRARAWWLRGMRSTLSRRDVPRRVRLVTACWFTVAVLAPRSALERVATPFFIPERRGRLARLVRQRKPSR